ncbi:hypothetical protein [Streptacidiphilus sp. PAMC 29251]
MRDGPRGPAVRTRWWLLVQAAADPATSATAAAVKAGTGPGRGATAVLRELHRRSTDVSAQPG